MLIEFCSSKTHISGRGMKQYGSDCLNGEACRGWRCETGRGDGRRDITSLNAKRQPTGREVYLRGAARLQLALHPPRTPPPQPRPLSLPAFSHVIDLHTFVNRPPQQDTDRVHSSVTLAITKAGPKTFATEPQATRVFMVHLLGPDVSLPLMQVCSCGLVM
ncbi:hypothetical protein E2C01_005101 [Portunus trituberculatus]|uniref:Uncharacterized protein n=1 Tax=Portunus trituberculatus TaxID=210409 RepID=A0A5B7CSF8_PORTR|nr:hypothetical protein [Portunus trituberculatus]